ncbi:uncharacterized protein LOC106052778 [Biomphalaria glabrata]|uniref:Mitochondrial cardiolipin hydrolase n=1 Tax=Biomphalaria glabrata TaxID=6526 RepID=A0A2C9K659_BIOGL|nr:uncharacterized protein LOC106052778 [Biomphalaria glabrata]
MSTFKGFLVTFVFFVASEILYKLYRRRQKTTKHGIRKNESERLSKSSLQVLFFPDKKIACNSFFLSSSGCLRDNCQYSHEKTSLSELYKHMTACQTSMDICVYVITCKGLADILSDLYKNGVKMRIITDKDQLSSSGSKIWNLRKEGIPVRVNDSSFLMHHKFVIVDEKILINGSFNWTYQAITGNQENVIITDDIAVTSLFKAEFQRLWDEFYKPLTQEEENQISLRQSRPPLKKQDFS